MMKKILSLMLALLMVLSLAACTSDSDRDEDKDDDRDNDPGQMNTDENTKPVNNSFNFEKTVLVDNDVCTFTIKSIEMDEIWGYTLNVYIENKTDLNLMFAVDTVSVNDFMCDPYWGCSVSPGMKSNESISFSESSLEELGILNVTDVTFTLRAYDFDDMMADPLLEESFTIYPMGEDAVEAYVRTPVEDEIVLFDNEDVTMIITGQRDDPYFGYTLAVYIENKTDKTLMFAASDVAVNGFMCDPYWASTVAPGKRAISGISWSDEAFAENDITKVESISLSIIAYDYNDWMADYIVDETFTIEPKF